MKRTPLALTLLLSCGAVPTLADNHQTGDAAAADTTAYLDMARSEDAAYRFRASDLIGMSILNPDEEDIGEVDDIVFGAQAEAPLAVVAVGGILGLGEKLVTVPADGFKLSRERDYLVLDATEEQLEALPEFAYVEGEKSWRDLREERQALLQERQQALAEAVAESEQELAEARAEATDEIWAHIESNWQLYRDKARQQWDQLTEEDLDAIEGDRDRLMARLQDYYQIDGKTARQQADDWALTLEAD